ncbi:MAG TPA: hypothetical protein VHN79_12565 [Lacunisphaera sp.]|nr:hypothetical protein [Lacunisphaera sp.]
MNPSAVPPTPCPRTRLWLACALTWGAALTGHAQFSRDPVLNLHLRAQAGITSIADNAMGALTSAAQYAQSRQAMTEAFEAARRDYWAKYPDQPGFAEAEREFARQLERRELYYLWQTLATGRPMTQVSALNVLTGGSRGYEIPFAAQNLFFNGWVPELRRQLGATGQQMLNFNAMTAEDLRRAMEAAQPAYQEYVIKRDLEEFRRAGRMPPGVDASYWHFVSGLVDLLDEESMPFEPRLDNLPEYRGWSGNDRVIKPAYEFADRLYRDTEQAFGRERLQAASAEIAAVKGPVPCPPELGRWTDSNRFVALMNRLGSGSARFFLLGQLRGGGRSIYEWTETEKVYAVRVKQAGGEAALLAAAERLRLAPKEPGKERDNYALVANPGEFGSEAKAVDGCLRDLLGVGEQAMKARERAEVAAARARYDFSGEYGVIGQLQGRKYSGTLTVATNADGTLTLTNKVDSPDWTGPRTFRQVARWHETNEIRLDLAPAGELPEMSYLIDYRGRSLRGKWGEWEKDLGRVEVTRIAWFREQTKIGGVYDVQGPRWGTVTISPKPDGTYLFDWAEVPPNGVGEIKYQGIGRWEGLTIKVDFKDKRRPGKIFTVAGRERGEVLQEPTVPERLTRKRQPANSPGTGTPPSSEETSRRRRAQ